MTRDDTDDRLSRIETLWTVVQRAHQGGRDEVTAAQKALMERYRGAVYRYLLAALRDPHAADDLFQDFCLRFLRGDFRRADPQRGRFRDFVKTALFHLIVDHQRQRKRRPLPLNPEGWQEPAASDSALQDADREFLKSWRDELLHRAWQALKDHEAQTGQPFFTVLCFRAEHPQLSSAQMAEQVGERLGRRLTAEGVRQTLHRARERFAALLLAEVSQSLEQPDDDRVKEELADLGLLQYCQAALKTDSPRP